MKEESNVINEMFEYTDFGGDIGGHVLVMKADNYDTEETLRAKIKYMTDKQIRLAEESLVRRVREEIKNTSAVWTERTPGWDSSQDDAFEDGSEVIKSKILSLPILQTYKPEGDEK